MGGVHEKWTLPRRRHRAFGDFNDELHREDGPACAEPGTKSWYVHGHLHRTDGPAVIWGDGCRWSGGLVVLGNCEDGPAVLNADGSCYWYLNGSLHRVGAASRRSHKWCHSWYQAGELHREDGPAVEGADGTREWYNRAVKLSEEEFNRQNKAFNPKKLHEVRGAW